SEEERTMFDLPTWLLKGAIGFALHANSSAGTRKPPPRSGDRLKILIVTDAWAPQVNGVVRTLETLGIELDRMGHLVRYATPENRTTLPLPTYPEIRLALFPRQAILRALEGFTPDAIHIATEGPMGLSARAYCMDRGWRFTTSFHTRFPEYVHTRFPFIPETAVYGALKS